MIDISDTIESVADKVIDFRSRTMLRGALYLVVKRSSAQWDDAVLAAIDRVGDFLIQNQEQIPDFAVRIENLVNGIFESAPSTLDPINGDITVLAEHIA